MMILPYDTGAAAAYDCLSGRWSNLYLGAVLGQLEPLEGRRLLDLATGTAECAVAAAKLIDRGLVVGADFSLPMLQGGLHKLGNARISLVAADAHHLPFKSGQFDGVACLFGLMFFEDPVAALKEAFRVLVPGGKLICTTWATTDRVPWGGVMAEVLAAEAPHLASELLRPYSMADPEAASKRLSDAGFSQVEAERVTRHASYSSLEEYLHPFERGGGRLGQFYVSLDSDRRAYVRQKVCARLAPWMQDGRISMEAEAILTTACKLQ